MNKRYISLTIVFLLTIGTLPALFANGETHLVPGIVFAELDGANECYQLMLLQDVSNTLTPGSSATYYPPGGILDDCYYILYIEGRDLCVEGCADFNATVKLKNGEEETEEFRSCNGDSIKPFELPIPGNIWREVEYIKITNEQTSDCGITYTWKLYSLCPCKSNIALYPKVDIEQFSVTGGSTIIKDGKILSSFNVVPGVQQTMIQVENRGFFTQKDARVRFMGLPEGVTVELTPATQTIKAHNIGTYSATFTVGSNVPSGTYNIAMVAFSPNGIFDTIMIQLVVP
jgi:hypothetical protein